MEKIVKFIVDKETLLVELVFDNANSNFYIEIRTLLSNMSNRTLITDNTIKIPYSDFRNYLTTFIKIAKKNLYKIDSDEFSQGLVREIINNKKSLNQVAESKLSFRNICDILKDFGFNRLLNRRQFRDTQKLLQLKNGANFSVPGAGKTTTLLAVHSILKKQGLVNKLFIVCPINAFISWEDEIRSIFNNEVFLPHKLNVEEITQVGLISNLSPEIVIVNYEKLRRNIDGLIRFFIENDVHLVLDESHRIKSGENNLSYNQITKIVDISKRRDIMSGTPMPQSYLDLVPQFNFLWPGENLIPELNLQSDDQLLTLSNSISKFYVRTTKNELGLKDPIINYEFVAMGPIQQELYKLFKSEAARQIAQMDKKIKSNFRKIGRSVIKLLQAATNPMLLGSSNDYDEELLSISQSSILWELLDEYIKYEKPPKIERLKIKIDTFFAQNENGKILIWSSFIKNIKLLEAVFSNYNPVSIYGGISSGDDLNEAFREGRIRKFHTDPTCKIMIANPAACGEGISLHKVCHYAIYLDRTFNAAHYLQSVDRIHRLGLPKHTDTIIDIFVSPNSIDDIVQKRLNEKIVNMGNALNDKYLEKLAYDPDDIPLEEQNGLDEVDIVEIQRHLQSNG